MFSQSGHDHLVAQVYASAAGDTPWFPMLQALSTQFGATASVISVADGANRVTAAESYGSNTGNAAEYYAGETFANDPRTPYLFNVRPGAVYFDHMLYDVEAMSRNRWCRQAFDLLKVNYQLGVRSRLPNGLYATVAVLSNEREGHASDAAIAEFRRLAPHVEQACALGQVMETAAATRAMLLEALACKADGVMLLSATGSATFLNDSACAILEAGDGLAYAMGALVTRRASETRHLRRLVEQALSGSKSGTAASGRALVTRSSGRRPYVVSVMATPQTERFLAGDTIACVVHIQDLAAGRLPSRSSLRAVFGLSEREADLAIELVRCASLEPAAKASGMALNTARNHLQNISLKTGARGQTEIVQLLAQLP